MIRSTQGRIGLTMVLMVLLLQPLVLFAGGRPEQPAVRDEVDFSQPFDVPITWYLRAGIADTEDSDAVNERLNEVLAERGFNVGVQIEFINRPDYADRMSLVNTAGEQYDLALVTESWFNHYPQNVENEFLTALSHYQHPTSGETVDLLQEFTPGLWASMPEGGWDAARIDGVIYAIPNQQIWVRPFGVSIRRDIMEALDLRADIDALDNWADLTPILQTVQDAIDDGTLANRVADGQNLRRAFATADLVKTENARMDPIGPAGMVVRIDDDDLQVESFYFTDEFEDLVRIRRDWQERGLTTPDLLDPQEQIAGYGAGQYAVDVGRLVKPGGDLEQAARMGYSWYENPIAPAFIDTGGPTATMTGVSSTIEDNYGRLRAVLQFMEYVHTDPEIYNLIAKGIEGRHWDWVDEDAQLIRVRENSRYRPNIDWAIGNQFNALYIDPDQVGAWPETLELNQSAIASPALGFRFDASSVQTAVAAIQSITGEYLDPLVNGQASNVDAAIAEFRRQLTSAGINDLLQEAQSQIDAWQAEMQ